MSHKLWQREYGYDADILGDHIEIDNGLFLVVGIATSQDHFPSGADIWLPVSRMDQQDLARRERKRLWVVGRLKPGTTENQAEADLRSVMSALSLAYPRITDDRNVEVTNLLEYLAGNARSVLLLLMLAANLVLIITCFNIANLLLENVSDRKLEVTIRSAIGAPRGAIAKQLLIESILLSTTALLFGIMLSIFMCYVVMEWIDFDSSVPRIDQSTIDTSVVLYAGIIAILSTIAFGIWPSVRGSDTDLEATLKSGSSSIGVPAGDRTQTFLILCEVAIAVVVLAAATTLVARLWTLRSTNLGFRSDHTLVAEISLPRSRYPTGSKISAFYDHWLSRLRSLRGIEDASATNVLPLSRSLALMRYGIDGSLAEPKDQHPVAQIRTVAPGYFRLMGIPLTEGRTFRDSDTRGDARPAYIVNEALAQARFHGEDPLTRELVVVEAPVPFRVPIVGVAANVRDVAIDKRAEPTIYSAGYSRQSALLVRTESEPLAFVDVIRREVQSVDAYQPLGFVSTMDDLVL